MWSTPRMRNVTTTFFIRCQCNMIISILLFVNLLSLFCFNKQQEFNKEITYIALLLVQVVQFQFQYLLSLIHICTNTIHWHPQRLNILRHHQNISWKSSEGVSTFMIKKEKKTGYLNPIDHWIDIELVIDIFGITMFKDGLQLEGLRNRKSLYF